MRLDLSGSKTNWIIKGFQSKYMVRNQISPNASYGRGVDVGAIFMPPCPICFLNGESRNHRNRQGGTKNDRTANG